MTPHLDTRPPSSAGAAPATVAVTFEESECVTTGGTTTVTYSVLWNRVWLSPSRIEGAEVEQLSRVPQVIWRRRVTVGLPVGTPVERITHLPQRGEASAADLLLGKAKGLRQRTRRDTYLVTQKGNLVRR